VADLVRRPPLPQRLLCLVAVLLLGACGSASVGDSPTPRVGGHIGDVAPALAGTSIEGHPLSMSAWRGSVVVVLFWRSWCTPCQAEQPAVNSLARELMSSGVHFAGVSVDSGVGSRSAAQSYATRFMVPYDSLFDPTLSLDVDFEVGGLPWTFVIGKSGRVAAELAGPVDIPTLRADVAAAQSAA
jgi:cytochrome c biogenesis protein CcmG/thiol:disulfide interchange protein DsbE